MIGSCFFKCFFLFKWCPWSYSVRPKNVAVVIDHIPNPYPLHKQTIHTLWSTLIIRWSGFWNPPLGDIPAHEPCSLPAADVSCSPRADGFQWQIQYLFNNHWITLSSDPLEKSLSLSFNFPRVTEDTWGGLKEIHFLPATGSCWEHVPLSLLT